MYVSLTVTGLGDALDMFTYTQGTLQVMYVRIVYIVLYVCTYNTYKYIQVHTYIHAYNVLVSAR